MPPTPVPPGVTGGALLGNPRARFAALPGKRFGWKPRPPGTPRLWLCHYLQKRGLGALPTPPPSTDRRSRIKDWGMKKNDVEGICVVASAAHLEMLFSLLGRGALSNPSDSECDQRYHGWCGAGDNGCVLSDVLTGWHRDTLGGDTIIASAGINPADPLQVQDGIFLFGGTFNGCYLPQSAIDAFERGEDWTDCSQPGNPLYGHGFPAIDYDLEWVYLVTWGRVVRASWQWWQTYVGTSSGEADVIAHPAWFSAQKTPPGLDLAALAADWSEMTGLPSPIPAPAPPAPPLPMNCFQQLFTALLAGQPIVAAIRSFLNCLNGAGHLTPEHGIRATALFDLTASGVQLPWRSCLSAFLSSIVRGTPLPSALADFLACLTASAGTE